MKDLAAVAPLLLVAGVFVGVCIVALRATDWRRLDDRRQVATPEPEPVESADAPPTGDDAVDRASASDATEAEDATGADVSTGGTDPAAARTEARDPVVAADDEPGVRPGGRPVDPDAAAPRGRGRHRAEPGT